MAKTPGASSAGDAMVVTRSRADQVPVSLLLSREGDELMVLETADVVHLPDQWVWPQPLSLDASGCDAAGAAVKLYGTLFRPSHFCETQQYPVINMIVGGPWLCATPHGSFHNSRGYAESPLFSGGGVGGIGFYGGDHGQSRYPDAT